MSASSHVWFMFFLHFQSHISIPRFLKTKHAPRRCLLCRWGRHPWRGLIHVALSRRWPWPSATPNIFTAVFHFPLPLFSRPLPVIACQISSPVQPSTKNFPATISPSPFFFSFFWFGSLSTSTSTTTTSTIRLASPPSTAVFPCWHSFPILFLSLCSCSFSFLLSLLRRAASAVLSARSLPWR